MQEKTERAVYSSESAKDNPKAPVIARNGQLHPRCLEQLAEVRLPET